MLCYDPGHTYELFQLDSDLTTQLRFVKREGPNYPGNKGHYTGTTIQEVMRASIDRIKYLHWQKQHWINPVCLFLLRVVLNLFEYRAACLHKRRFKLHLIAESVPVGKDLHWTR